MPTKHIWTSTRSVPAYTVSALAGSLQGENLISGSHCFEKWQLVTVILLVLVQEMGHCVGEVFPRCG